jgi:ribonuclease HI
MPPHRVVVLVDGTPRGALDGTAGLGAVICTPRGRMLAWQYRDAPARTSMEAEYQAVIAGLRFVLERYGGAQVRCLSDSRVVVEQLAGRYAVRAAALKPLHAQAVELARQLGQVEFVAIPRQLNNLADALAGFQTAQDQVVGLLGQRDEG